MTEAIKQAKSTIDELTDAKTIQAILTVVLTLVLGFMFVLGREIPEPLYYAWFAMLGIYMELPGRKNDVG